MAPKILVVDDDPKIVQVVSAYLEAASYPVISAANGRQALDLFRAEAPDLILLDLRIPELHGMDVVREIRKASSVPIIMLTAQTEDIDKVAGLESGADDYVTKPFNPRELVSRVRAVLRRSEAQPAQAPVKVFVSSVMVGYQEARSAVREVADALHDAGFAVRAVFAESVPADPQAPRQALLQEVDSSDIYVGIFGRRYGYVNPETGQSATEEEYQRAREGGKKILVFIERLPEGEKREPRQEELVRRVKDYTTGHYVGSFENPDQLRFSVYRALERLLLGTPRGGG